MLLSDCTHSLSFPYLCPKHKNREIKRLPKSGPPHHFFKCLKIFSLRHCKGNSMGILAKDVVLLQIKKPIKLNF